MWLRTLKFRNWIFLSGCHCLCLPHLQLADRFPDLPQIHLVHFHTLADLFQQHDGELAAEVFAEFLESG